MNIYVRTETGPVAVIYADEITIHGGGIGSHFDLIAENYSDNKRHVIPIGFVVKVMDGQTDDDLRARRD